jgi:hypothetical protein
VVVLPAMRGGVNPTDGSKTRQGWFIEQRIQCFNKLLIFEN